MYKRQLWLWEITGGPVVDIGQESLYFFHTFRIVLYPCLLYTSLKLTQICTGRIACEIGFVIMFRNFSQVASGVGTVSYTHLDVYKRQIQYQYTQLLYVGSVTFCVTLP